MNHLIRLFTDFVLGFYDEIERTRNFFCKNPEPSLIASNVFWCTDSGWMDRLIAYHQLELWTANK